MGSEIPEVFICTSCGWAGYEDSLDPYGDLIYGSLGFQCPACGSLRVERMNENLKMSEM